MQVTQIGAAFASTDPTAAGGWFADHLGFRVLVDLGWYVSTQHPDHEDLRVDFVRADHETWPAPASAATSAPTSAPVRGAMVALVVDDVDERHERMLAAGASILKPLVTEPWGQRRFQAAGPDGLVVELVQPVEPDPAWMSAQGLAG
ncbi:VOC family protein [Nocardioides sp. SOB77]|uniref:VOC family protein n=1 Tax=Nocardioides oceani TaxID=3058369 RepID=A0ABT8FAG6_9ACTN|nr:VOC family protein [Nocardioides oceani]MDN4171676.1 VOC family protein [Nocardioides oceani]